MNTSYFPTKFKEYVLDCILLTYCLKTIISHNIFAVVFFFPYHTCILSGKICNYHAFEVNVTVTDFVD